MGRVEVHNVDVGQGDATFITAIDNDRAILILIDGGKNEAGDKVYIYWKNHFEAPIDIVVISHWDADHYGGIEHCKDTCPEMFKERCKLYSPKQGQRCWTNFFDYQTPTLKSDLLDMDFASLICYATDTELEYFYSATKDMLTYTPTNHSSLVYLLLVKDSLDNRPYRYYTAGDLDEEAENQLVSTLPEGKTFVLDSIKVSHHGSSTSTSEYFLDRVVPSVAVISVGRNTFNHPTKETLERLNSRNIVILTTSWIDIKKDNLIMSCGDGIRHFITPTSYDLEIELDKRNSLVMEGDIGDNVHLEMETLSDPLQGMSLSVTSNSQLEKLVLGLFPGNAYEMDESGTVCHLDECRVHSAVPYRLTECVLTLSYDENISFTALWNGELMAGNATLKGWSLKGCNSHLKMSFKDLVALVANTQKMHFFEYLPNEMFPLLEVNTVCFTRRMDALQTLQVDMTATVGKDINLGNGVRLLKPTVFCRSGVIGKQGLKWWNVGIDTCLNIGTYELDCRITFTTCRLCKLRLTSAKFTLTDIIALLPGTALQKVKDWCEWLRLPTVSIDRGCLNVILGQNIRLKSADFYFSLFLFDNIRFEIECTYILQQEHVLLNGICNESLPLKILLMDLGVKKEHLNFLPNLIIECCTMNAIPKNKSFSLATEIYIEKGIAIYIASLAFSLQKVGMSLCKKEKDIDIQLVLVGELNGKQVNLNVEYDCQTGFTFEGILEQINTAAAIGSIVPLQNNLLEKFNLQMDNVAFSFKKGDIQFSTLLPCIELGKNVHMKQNEISIHVRGMEVEFWIDTHLSIQTEGRTIEVAGKLAISKESIYLSAISETPYANVLGIKGLNIGKVVICLDENLTPPGMGIGLMGELAFGHLQGDMALYLSPQIPDKVLVAINFNGISLLDIVSVFVQCQDGGVAQALGYIALEPILLADTLITNSIEETISIIRQYESGSGAFDVLTHDTYSWIPATRIILKNKTNYKTYELEVISDGKYRLQKYVGMYACINPMGEGIEMNGVMFRPGFAFDAHLRFLNMSCNIDFSAEPKRGLKLYAEMEKAVSIGHWLTICRMENSNQGPVLYLSLYPECFYFYLSAQLNILSLIKEEAKIMIGQNSFFLFLHSNVLGFSTTIEADGELNLWNGKEWKFSFRYETNGLTGVTQAISDFLHQTAEKIDQATHSAVQKLKNAQRTVEEHERDILNTQNQIEEKQRELENLMHTHYPWYKAYMYIALGVRIAAIGVQIGALAAYKLTLLGILETAKGILKLAEKAVQTSGELTADAIKAIGDVTAIIGKSIDWLIRLDEVAATLDLEKNQIEFDFSIYYQLCGKAHQQKFYLHKDQNLQEILIQIIKGGNHLLTEEKEISLDNLYGEMDEKERNELQSTDWQLVKKRLGNTIELSERYNLLLEALNNDMILLGNTNDEDLPSFFTLNDARHATYMMDECLLTSEKMRNLTRIFSQEDFRMLDHAQNVLQQEVGFKDKIRTALVLQKENRILAEKANRLQIVSTNGLISLKRYLQQKCITPESGVLEPKDEISQRIIIEHYEQISREDSSISAFSRSMICSGLAEILKKNNDFKRARLYAQRAIELTTDYFGENSHEELLMKERLQDLQ